MTVEEFVKQLKEYPQEAEITIEFLSATVCSSYTAEPKLVKWGDRVVILSGRRRK